MFEPGNVLEVLREARDLVLHGWGSTNPDVGAGEATGSNCASVAICNAPSSTEAALDDMDEAHAAVLRGAGLSVPADYGDLYGAVYRFNDLQVSRGPIVEAFDKAIAQFESVLV